MFKIPLSSTPFNAAGIADILNDYEGQPVMKLVDDFEAAICQYTGARYALALNSGTAAIHLGLKVLGVGPGDVVIAPSFTYVATVGPVLYQGAQPVFVDSEQTTWNISPDLLEKAIKSQIEGKRKPKCVIVVHNYGMPAQMRAIKSICDRYEIPILEDAAEALGSQYFGAYAGTLGQIGIFSFNNNKVVTAYGGGVLVTGDKAVYDKALFWATQSREDKPYYEHTDLGYNYRMSPLNAAAGILELRSVKAKIEQRRNLFSQYKGVFGSWESVAWLEEPDGFKTNRWLSTALFSNPLIINDIMEKTKRQGIECRRLWKPMHLQPYYKKYPSFVDGTGETLFQQGICLPSGGAVIVGDVFGILDQL